MAILIIDFIRALYAPIALSVRKISAITLGRLDARIFQRKQQLLLSELKEALPFLFGKGRVVGSINVMEPHMPADYAIITVQYGCALYRFISGRRDLVVHLARVGTPQQWRELVLVLAALDGDAEPPERRFIFDLAEAATLIEPRLGLIERDFGVDTDGKTNLRLEEFRKADFASARAREFAINSHLYGNKSTMKRGQDL